MSAPLNLDLGGMLPLGEKWNILNQIVARTELRKVDDTLNDFCKDQPASLSNLLKFLLADKFHRFDLMLELLYAGDAALLNRIIAKRWMYEDENSSLIDSQFLLEQLFPKVSYVCRQKILNKIGRHARNEAKIDQLWNAVEKMYGFDVAFPLFAACSENVISSVMAKHEVKLSGYQVVTLLQKCPEIGLKYFKNNKVDCSKMNPRCSPLHYLYKHRPGDFLDLCINHSDKLKDFKIGRNRSTKLIREHRNKLLEHPYKTNSLLKLDRIQREFSSEEYQSLFEYYLKQFISPEDSQYDWEYYWRNYWEWVSKVPKYRKVHMVNEAYANLCGIDLNEHLNYVCEEYVFLLPEERRLQAVEWKMERVEKDTERSPSWSFKGITETVYSRTEKEGASIFLQLKPTSHSVPELKKLLLVEQNVARRAILCKYLIQTCYLNDDLPALLEVLKLLSKRTRNDSCEVRHAILGTVNKIKNMEFSKEHWDIIMDIVQVSLVFKDDDSFNEMEKIVQRNIAFRLNSNLPLDGSLITMHTKLKMHTYWHTFSFSHGFSIDNKYVKNAAGKRELLESYAKEWERLELNNDFCDYDGKNLSEENLAKFVIELLKTIWHFNCDSEESDVAPISLSSHQWLISNFERIAKEEERKLDEHCNGPAEPAPKRSKRSKRSSGYDFWGLPNKLQKLVQWLRDEETQFVDAFHGSDYYFSKMWLCLPNHQTIKHFLEKNPSHLLENWTGSISRMLELKPCVALMRTLKFWNYSTLVSQTVDQCIEMVHAELGEKPNAVEISRKCNAMLVLSSLMEPCDFLAFLNEFYPAGKEVDIFAKKSDEKYKMAKAITRSIINVSVPHLAFDALMKFSVGDYLKLVIDSFYSQMLRAQSTKSLDFLRQQLINVPVSRHKHIIRLYCTISSVDHKMQVLKSVNSSNVTIRYVVFQQIITLFQSYPTQEIWTLLKSVIESTTKEDAEILKFLCSTPALHTWPLEYISDYISLCIGVLRKLEPRKVDKFVATRCSKITEKIPEQSLDTLLMHDIENVDSFNADFCVAYLKNSSTESILQHRLSNMSRVLDNVIGRGWNVLSEKQKYLTRSLVNGFIDGLAKGIENSSEVWRENQIYQTLLDKFTAMSTSTFFCEILKLQLALLHVGIIKYNSAERLKQFGNSLIRFVDDLVENYGNEIFQMAISTIGSSVQKIFPYENMQLELVDVILQASTTRANQLFAINMLCTIRDKNKTKKLIETLEKVNQICTASDDIVIKTYYASFNRC